MTKKEILSILREHKEEFRKKYGVTKIGLFGSYARDEATETSDVDIVVEMKHPSFLYLAQIKEILEKDLHKKIDLVRLRKNINKYLKEVLQKEAEYV